MPHLDREKKLACQRQHYEANKGVYKKRAREHTNKVIAENKELLLRFLISHPCVDCGEADPLVLIFDHVRGEKYKNVSALVRNGASWSKIMAEIEKCEVRCANCHSRKTAKDQGWHKLLARVVNDAEWSTGSSSGS